MAQRFLENRLDGLLDEPRSMSRASGISATTIPRIWHAFSLQPHRSKTFELSKAPLFIEKVRDIVGLYLAPPIWIRADPGLARESILAWCAANDVHYVLGLAKHAWLRRALGGVLAEAEAEHHTGAAVPRTRLPHAQELEP